MPKLSRRALARIAAAGAGTAILGGAAAFRLLKRDVDQGAVQPPVPVPAGVDPTIWENQFRGSDEWRLDQHGIKPAGATAMQISGYAGQPSVNLGESLEFHISVRNRESYVISIYRFGHYGGIGARKIHQSPRLDGVRQPEPTIESATRTVRCGWEPSWKLDIPETWTSGTYLAVFTTESGFRSFAPFVVRNDSREAALCVVMPFTTYHAYNLWPFDGVRGASLYYGFTNGKKDGAVRAASVSFDRPYPHQGGLPSRFEFDLWFINWAEAQGYDLTYATSIDLHEGRVDPTKYAGLVFPGHDEYWTEDMVKVANLAVAGGTSLAFFEANNVYWKIRLASGPGGRPNRIMICYKKFDDPEPDASGPTVRWRHVQADGAKSEQRLLGVQFNGIVAKPTPLVVQAADHWFWAGTGVKNGDKLEGVVGGEADGFDPSFPVPTGKGLKRVLLSESPYQDKSGNTVVQNTSLYVTANGAVVFACGSNDWPAALSAPGRQHPQIQQATKNLLDRIVHRSPSQ